MIESIKLKRIKTTEELDKIYEMIINGN